MLRAISNNDRTFSSPNPETTLSSRAQHVAIIMDGNGRWAAQRGLPRTIGHLRGMASVRHAVRRARTAGIPNLTLFAFSSENWNRDAWEVTAIMALLERYLHRQLPALSRHGIRLRVIGDRSRLPAAVQDAILKAERSTVSNDGMTLTLAISYGGQDEIVHAARETARACLSGTLHPAGIDRTVFARHLEIPELPPVDLLIRTGGEQRISNFLLWQLAYAELIFLPQYWPDFRERDLDRCLEEFAHRHRRFGREL